jgi:hypothetical protein
MAEQSEPRFLMKEPKPEGRTARYAFWLTAKEDRLFTFTEALPCVAQVHRESTHRALVDIKDDYDADEAWHFIRTELEDESQFVELDSIWEDALWL